MAFCIECGSKIQDGMKFCPYCGSPVAQSARPEQAAITDAPGIANARQPQAPIASEDVPAPASEPSVDYKPLTPIQLEPFPVFEPQMPGQPETPPEPPVAFEALAPAQPEPVPEPPVAFEAPEPVQPEPVQPEPQEPPRAFEPPEPVQPEPVPEPQEPPRAFDPPAPVQPEPQEPPHAFEPPIPAPPEPPPVFEAPSPEPVQYTYQPPLGPSPPETQDARPHKSSQYALVGTFSYIGLIILYAIPVIGWIFCVVMAFAARNRNIRNYARAVFILGIIVIALIVSGIIWFAWIFDSIYDNILSVTAWF